MRGIAAGIGQALSAPAAEFGIEEVGARRPQGKHYGEPAQPPMAFLGQK